MSMKRLVVLTFTSFALVVILSCYLSKSHLPEPIEVKHEEYPTIGNKEAKVHVVILEEPKCINCHRFNSLVFPKLKKDFLDTGRISLTVIPVSFLPNSMPAAEALFCVYDSDSGHPRDELFFTYLDYMFQHQPDERHNWATVDKLVEMAEAASPEIDTSQLRMCIEEHRYEKRVEENNDYGKKLLGGSLATPTVFVNGVRIEELSYPVLEEVIHEKLAETGS